MQGFSYTNCSRCDSNTAHDIYVSQGGYLHSLCTQCGYDVVSDAEISHQNGNAQKHCNRCEISTEHIRYISTGGYIHWLCCSCGFDVASDAKENR